MREFSSSLTRTIVVELKVQESVSIQILHIAPSQLVIIMSQNYMKMNDMQLYGASYFYSEIILAMLVFMKLYLIVLSDHKTK